MGVDYSAVSGYGFVLSEEEDDIEAMATNIGYVSKYGPDEFDSYDFLEWLCATYHVNYAFAGSAYGGGAYILIGKAHSISLYGLQETEFPHEFSLDPELNDRLELILTALGIERKIAFYSGLYVH